ncbi:MAG: hypothetical protein OHK0038_14600 [Flammeovirgaceae bacterium]
MKKFILSIALLLSLNMLSFGKDILLDQKAEKNINENAISVNSAYAEMLELEAIYSQELETSIEEAIASVTEEVKAIYIYDLNGNLLESKTEGEISLSDVPFQASLLMKDGNVYYYILEK